MSQGSTSSTFLVNSEWRKAQSRQQIAEKIRTLCAENLRCFFWHMATSKKQLFCHSREKAAHKYVDEIDAMVFVNVIAFFKVYILPGLGSEPGISFIFSHFTTEI